MEEDILSSLPKKLVPGLKYSKKFDIDITEGTTLKFFGTVDFAKFKSPNTTIDFYLQNNNEKPMIRIDKGKNVIFNETVLGNLKAGKLTVNFDVNIDESETDEPPFLLKIYKIPPKQNKYNMVIIGLVLLLALYMCYVTFRKNRFAFGKRRR